MRDLLTHTSGLMSGGPASRRRRQPAAQRTPDDTLATYIPRLGAVPLDFQPGTLWRYSGLAGFDVAQPHRRGRIGHAVRSVPAAAAVRSARDEGHRLHADPGAHAADGDRSTAAAQGGGFQRQANQDGLSSATYFSASGGLVSTAEDYLQFAQMLVNGGELNGKRYLGPKTVELMASNHTGELVNGQFGRPARGMGFGLGVQVVEDPVAADLRAVEGDLGMGRRLRHQHQHRPAGEDGRHHHDADVDAALQRDFENAVMQAIID